MLRVRARRCLAAPFTLRTRSGGALARLGAGLALIACSDPPATAAQGFPATPYATLTSDSGELSVEVRTAPTQPPTRGTLSVELFVRSVAGVPQDGLTVSVIPWMPYMGHGTSVVPTVTAEGGGKYLVSNLSLFMPGTWELRTTFTGSTIGHLVPTFEIQ